MRIVILTLAGPEHRHVASALAEAFPAEVAAIVVADPPSRTLLSRTRAYWRRYTVGQLGSRLAAKAYDSLTGQRAMRSRRVARFLDPRNQDAGMPREDLVRRVAGHNHASCLALLDELAPDIIAVYGTSVIRESTIARARIATVNMHTGISPRYRGADSVFWALHNREPEWVGATVHLLDPTPDAGPILGIRKPHIESNDDEASLFAKCVRVGALLYVDMISSLLLGTTTPSVQNLREGREYRFVDRTVAAERRVSRFLREGLLERFCVGTP